MTPAEFRAARKTLGMTQPEMAEALLCSLRLVQYMEAGKRKITPRTKHLLEILLANPRSARSPHRARHPQRAS